MKLWQGLLLSGLGLVLIQQQVLQRRPPRLLEIQREAPGSALAAVGLRFSRAMDGASLRSQLRLVPDRPHELLGEGTRWRLQLTGSTPITTALEVQFGGRDSRGQQLQTSRWRWEPRPTLIASRPQGSHSQLLRWNNNGDWLPLTSVSGELHALQPLGNGAGLALVSARNPLEKQIWRLPISSTLVPAALQPLEKQSVVFASLSSNDAGDLLVQQITPEQRQTSVTLWTAAGRREPLPITATGTIQLVPQGGLAVVPESDGLVLLTLPPRAESRNVLPGLRDLSSFCPQVGRALLVRHWPDYRRSLELLEPGKAPQQLWVGRKALVGSACSGAADRIWVLLLSGIRTPILELMELNRQGEVLRQRELSGYELDPGSGMQFDPSRRVLLLLLRRRPADGQQPEPLPQAHLLSIDDFKLTAIPGPVGKAGWLPSRQLQPLE